jgi:putative oxidoreductase
VSPLRNAETLAARAKPRWPEDWALLSGRLMLVILFLPAGIGKLTQFAGTAGFIASKGLPAPTALAAATIALELGASVALLVGWQVRWAALALCAFSLLAGALFHDFWAVAPDLATAQRQAFFKNVAIAGGLLILAAVGAGRIAIDARRAAGH